MTTNFITPPDFVTDPNHTVLLVDVDPADVETLAFLCANHEEAFNVYLYKEDMDDTLYLNRCAERADAVIINTVDNSISHLKEHLALQGNSYYYGPKTFIQNPRKCQTVLDYFINRANERKQSTNPL